MIARINHVTRNTKEMQNYSGDKSIFGVLEQILLKSCFEHGQLLKDKTKVSVRDKTSSPQQAQCPYASGALIRINFHPQTAEKMAPYCMARLDMVNCKSQGNATGLRACSQIMSSFLGDKVTPPPPSLSPLFVNFWLPSLCVQLAT